MFKNFRKIETHPYRWTLAYKRGSVSMHFNVGGSPRLRQRQRSYTYSPMANMTYVPIRTRSIFYLTELPSAYIT